MLIPINPATVDYVQQFTINIQNMVTRPIPMLTTSGIAKLDVIFVVMLIWTGMQYGIGAIDNIRASLFGLVTGYVFGLMMLRFYDTPIWGLSSSFHQLIPHWASWMAATIDISSVNVMNDWGNKILANIQKPSLFDGMQVLTFLAVLVSLSLMYCLSFCVTIMGYIGVAYFSIIGPQFICWLIFPPLESLFGGWLRGLLTFSFFRVSSSVVIYLFATFISNYLASSLSNGDYSLGHFLQIVPYFIAFLLAFAFALLGSVALAIMPFSGVGHIQGPVSYVTAMAARFMR